jgi:hypothetical protein
MRAVLTRSVLFGVPALILIVFVYLIEFMPDRLGPLTGEDGPVENLTALGFALAALGFGLAAWRAPALQQVGSAWARAATVCWALLMFLAMGEEISWGQRIFGIETPEAVARVNLQNELTIHNIGAVNEFLGGTHRYLSIYMLMTGLGIPLFAQLHWGRSLFRVLRFPVLPWYYSALFVGAYLYAKYYRVWFPIPELQPANAPTEIRELLTAIGSAFFGIHAAVWPRAVYIDPKS